MVSAASLAGQPPRAVLRQMQAVLQNAGCPDAGFDARELYRFVTGQDPHLAATPPDAAALQALAALTARRAAREPLQYILGSWDFLDLTLKVGPGVLCPRADSEIVCEKAIELLRGWRAPRVLDLCAGTGCLGLGILRFVPGAQVTCVEKEDAAFAYLRYNAAHALPGATVAAVQADVLDYWQTLAPGCAELIISNPPYLTAGEMAELMPETGQEPAAALAGGTDGLDFYRCLLRDYKTALRPGGWLVLEIGCAQTEAVQALAAQNGWQHICHGKDYGGNDRVVAAQKAVARQISAANG